MKLGAGRKVMTESDFQLKVGQSDELDEFAKEVSDKSGTEFVKKNNVVRNLDYMNQKGSETGSKVEVYDKQVAAQVKQSIAESVRKLKRKYLNLIESGARKQNEDEKFKFKPNPRVTKPVFEEVKMPKRSKLTTKK